MRFFGRLFTLLGVGLTAALVHSWLVLPVPAAPDTVEGGIVLPGADGDGEQQEQADPPSEPLTEVPDEPVTTTPEAGDPIAEESLAEEPIADDPIANVPEPVVPAAEPVQQAEAPSRVGTLDNPCIAFDPTVPVPTAVDISLEQARLLWAYSEAVEAEQPGTEIVFIDARALPGAYDEGHISGALHLTTEMIDLGDFAYIEFRDVYASNLNGGNTVVVIYCGGGDCDESKNVRNRLAQEGYTNVFIFTDGYPAWRDCGLPIVTGPDRFFSQ